MSNTDQRGAHTPTPWAYMEVKQHYHKCSNHEGKEIVTVATVYVGDVAIARCHKVEDAAFIVQACNAHHELVRAVKFAHDMADEEYNHQMGNVGAECTLRHIIQKTSAAIAAAQVAK